MSGGVYAMFGARVREERARIGLTQLALAHAAQAHDVTGDGEPVKLDDTAIARIERGARAVSLPQAVAIARALELPLSSLLEPSMAMGAVAELARAEKDADELRVTAQMAEGKADVAEARVERLRRIVAEHQATEHQEDP